MKIERNMGEAQVIHKTKGLPATVESLKNDLAALGVVPGMVLLVHSSLSSLGWVSGGPVAVILALEETLGPLGTLVMPAHSGDYSDPEIWENPPVPESWKELIRQTMPPFMIDLTPSRGIGVIAETFRKQDGVLRSDHPHFSFTARGLKAAEITSRHELNFGLGEGSPLARIYEADGWVLLLGAGHDSNTSLHLSEYRAEYPTRKVIETGAPILVDGKRRWVTMKDIDLDTSDFERMGKNFKRTAFVRTGKVGKAQARLMSQRALVDFGVRWIEQNRIKT